MRFLERYRLAAGALCALLLGADTLLMDSMYKAALAGFMAGLLCALVARTRYALLLAPAAAVAGFGLAWAIGPHVHAIHAVIALTLSTAGALIGNLAYPEVRTLRWWS